jgi:hypothetical protein
MDLVVKPMKYQIEAAIRKIGVFIISTFMFILQ